MSSQSQIRNFVIIAHIDHGKSTLADRFLEITETVPKEKMREQYLDMMDLEQERGITIKLQPCRMVWRSPNHSEIPNSKYILNLIDTPGHVDFSYEVSRALAAVEGAILLVDAVKGIQAQTLVNLELARKQNLVIIPAVNKIDIPDAPVEETKQELAQILGISPEEVFEISARRGTNVKELLETVIKKTPCPNSETKEQFRALVFDSKYDAYKGVIVYIRVFDGKIKQGEKIYLIKGKSNGEVKEIGIFSPEMTPIQELSAGEVGYIATGIKEPGKVRIGDTITNYQLSLRAYRPSGPEAIINNQSEALPGYKEPKSVVFVSVYPEDSNDFGLLKQSLTKLKLNDPSLYFEPERKEIFGQGFRCGFLGSLHLEITTERLRREFGLNLVVFSPSVVYKAMDKKDKEALIFSSSDWEGLENKEVQEPWVKLEVMTPSNYLGGLMELLETLDGKYIETKYFGAAAPHHFSAKSGGGQAKLLLVYEVPLREIVIGFYDKLMEKTQGYASMNYEFLGYRKAELVKLDVLIAGQKERAFTKIVPKRKAEAEARNLARRLKEVLPSQQFSIPIQVVIGGKIIARETRKALRKDVTAPLYGGDYSRKRKLLEKQKKGKKKLKEAGKIKISPKIFLEVLKQGSQ